MTNATDTTRIANITSAYEAAKGAWIGRSWDDGDKVTPETTDEQIHKMLVEVGPYDIKVTCWGIDESTHEGQKWAKAIQITLDELAKLNEEDNGADFHEVFDDLRYYAGKSDAGVAAQAALAEKSARVAMDAVRAGEKQNAYVLAWEAARIERQYGDAPTWGPFADAVRAWSEAEGEEDPEVAAARTAYIATFPSLAAAVEAEETCLSVAEEFLPDFALAVREDNSAATVEYYQWLTEQTSGGPEPL